MKSLIDFWQVTIGNQLYTCRKCGAVTTDPQLHQRWHDESETA